MGDVGQLRQQRRVREHRRGRGLLEHEDAARRHVVRIDRQVGGAGLDDREVGHDQVERARQHRGDDGAGRDAACAQQLRETVGARVEFGIADGRVVEHHGGCLRALGGMRGHHGGQRARCEFARLAAPLREQPVLFLGAQDRELGDRRVGRVAGPLEQPGQPRGHGLDGGALEQVAAVLDAAADATGQSIGTALLAEDEREVELRGVDLHRLRRDRQARQAERQPAAVLEAQHHLEQRLVGARAARAAALQLHQAVVRELLVRVGREVGGAHARNQLAQAGPARGVGAQHQRVDEAADQLVERVVAAARDRAADHDVVARAEPAQEARERGLQHHEDAGLPVARQLQDALVHLRRDLQRHHVAAVARRQRARMVGGQRELFGQVLQRGLPEGTLAPGHALGIVLAAQQFLLPQRVVGVLQRQRRPARRPALAARRVGHAEVARQRQQRGAVAGDVVREQQQHVLVVGQPEQRDAQRRGAAEVEGMARGRMQLRGDLVLAAVGLEHGGPRLRAVEHLLPRQPVLVRVDGAQALVALHQVVERRMQGRAVERARQAQRQRHVVGRVRALELVHQPQAALREGQRDARRARHRHQAGPRHRFLVEQLGEAGDGRDLEQRVQRQVDHELLADHRDQLHDHQRVAAELEEVVVDAHALQVQRLGPEAGQDLLGGRARRGIGRGGLHLGRRQRLAVELAARTQRQRGQAHEGRGHHVVGQRLREVRAQLGRLRIGGLGRHEIGHQALLAGSVLARHHRGLCDLRMLEQHRLDLAGLDAQAADLHLLVGTAQVVQAAVGAPAREVAGAVHAAAGRAMRIGDEALGTQQRPAQVATRQARARDVELARHAGRHRLQAAVEHVHLRVPDRPADRHALRRGLRAFAFPRGDVDCGLGRAVEVVQLGAQALMALRLQRGRQRLAAADHAAQRGAAGGRGLAKEDLEHRGHEMQRRDALVGDQAREVGRVLVAAGPGEHQRGAVDQRPEELPHRHVEARGRLLQHAVVGREAVARLHPLQAVDDGAMRHHRALGPAGRARGVDHVGRVRGIERDGEVGLVAIRQIGNRLRPIDQQARGIGGQHLRERLGGDQARGSCVAEHEGDAIGREIGIDRQVGRAGLQGGEQRHHQFHRTRDRERHRALGARAACTQQLREAVGAAVQFGVGHRLALEAQRDGLGPLGELGLDQRDQVRVGHGVFGVVPAEQQLPALLGTEQVDMADGLLRLPDHGIDEGDQPALVIGQPLCGVHRGIGVEVDLQVLPVAALVKEDAQVLGRAVREVARPRRMAGETEVVVEGLDVDHGGEQLPVVDQHVEVAAQVFVAVRLVAQHLPHLAAHFADQFGGRQVGAHREPQRHGIGHHRGHAPHALVVARGDRDADRHVLDAGGAIEVGRGGGDQDLRQRGAELLRDLLQRLHAGRGQVHRLAQQAADVDRALRCEAQRIGRVGEALGPVLAVARKAARFAVGAVFLGQLRQRRQARGLGHLGCAFGHRAVDVGEAPCDQPAAEAVEHDVVAAVVPDVAIRREADQRRQPQLAVREVDVAFEVRAHPALGPCRGIGLGAEVEVGDLALEGVGHHLARPLARVDEVEPRGLDLLGDAAHGREEDGGIDRAVDVDGFREVEIGVGRRELRAQPHRHLTRGERRRTAQGTTALHALLQVGHGVANGALQARSELPEAAFSHIRSGSN